MKYDDFEKILLEDLGWRKKEISQLYLMASDVENEILLKSMILILYAHWEGYIKQSSKLYIKYICEKKVKICDLTYNFKAIVLKLNVANIIDSRENFNLSNEIKFMDKFEKMQTKKFKIAIDINDEFDNVIINTHDNLNPKVFRNILNILGLKYLDSFTSRENYINSNLLGNRNAIGHGSKFNSEIQDNFALCINDVSKLKTFIIKMIDFYTSMLLDYVENEFYLVSNKCQKEKYDTEKDEEFKLILEKIDKDNENKDVS
ncbi:hypothetical protein FDC45_03160 [Clostridium botulinum]|uniref:MAE-28990/MAE-18760-like HEPN domain-containing protein n=1 Tax=Clostridium botulinum TaxID=1491 RepID=A0A846J6S6_CLOBO|nr:MAE_28990/MAE_18760 family HEPN-like nuclease [Clostridium botulinum]ACA57147.1 conserved hypothetical protein [Clostridium botulinum A3 str. Loch Maree]NFH64893.1 hypothetical protein [Clostridium botulinum]NFJ08911.1 hypothetical protein [Clostridium botulinum]NFK16179.1 hypothetical protein [Clostridium botulinum]NFM92520.1 hypothetical protein [Clostridium botulinum]